MKTPSLLCVLSCLRVVPGLPSSWVASPGGETTGDLCYIVGLVVFTGSKLDLEYTL